MLSNDNLEAVIFLSIAFVVGEHSNTKLTHFIKRILISVRKNLLQTTNFIQGRFAKHKLVVSKLRFKVIDEWQPFLSNGSTHPHDIKPSLKCLYGVTT